MSPWECIGWAIAVALWMVIVTVPLLLIAAIWEKIEMTLWYRRIDEKE